MDYAALKLELRARTEDLSETRAGQFINDAYQELCGLYPWPFLETTVTGAAPLDISDIRQALEVIHVTSEVKLAYMSHFAVTEGDPALDDTGTPIAYYFTDGDTIAVYPLNTGSIRVRYLKVPAALSSGSDSPVVPARYHSLIVDMAQLRAVRRFGESQNIIPFLSQAVNSEQDRMCAEQFRQSNEALAIIPTGYF